MSHSARCVRLLAATMLVAPYTTSVHAADQWPAEPVASGPAVSGFNTKFSAEGGLLDGEGGGIALGSVSAPLGHAYGLQLDGALGSIDGELMGGGGVHLFTRDPSSYLLGVYGSYHTWNSIDVARLALEAEIYRGRFTFAGIGGWESIDVPTTQNGFPVLTSDDDHFFTEFKFSYYPEDNLRLSAGYNYVAKKSLAVAEIEYMPEWDATPASIFATGNFGDSDHTQVTGGIRFYFGADNNKTLIRRHREDDPVNYTPIFPKNIADKTNYCPTSGSGTGGDIFLLADNPGCICPAGTNAAAGGDAFFDNKDGLRASCRGYFT